MTFEEWWEAPKTVEEITASAKDIAKAAFQAGRDAMPVCLWNNVGECWETTCGHSFEINDGTPAENDMKYCCYCGGKVEEDIK